MIHDIAHCSNDKCKVKEQCYRWLAYQEIKQLKFDGWIVSMIQGKNTDCPYFINKNR